MPSAALLQAVRETLTPLTQHIVLLRPSKTEREASLGKARRRAGDAVTATWTRRGDTVSTACLTLGVSHGGSLTVSPTVSPSLCLAQPPSLCLTLCLPHCVLHRLPHRLSHCVSLTAV